MIKFLNSVESLLHVADKDKSDLKEWRVISVTPKRAYLYHCRDAFASGDNAFECWDLYYLARSLAKTNACRLDEVDGIFKFEVLGPVSQSVRKAEDSLDGRLHKSAAEGMFEANIRMATIYAMYALLLQAKGLPEAHIFCTLKEARVCLRTAFGFSKFFDCTDYFPLCENVMGGPRNLLQIDPAEFERLCGYPHQEFITIHDSLFNPVFKALGRIVDCFPGNFSSPGSAVADENLRQA